MLLPSNSMTDNIAEMWAVILVTAFFIIYLFTRNKRVHPSLPPGPPSLLVIGNLLSAGSNLLSYFSSLAEAYGPLFSFRLGAKLTVVVTSPTFAKEVLRNHDVVFASHDVPVAARVGTYGGDDIIWSPYAAQWRLLRKVSIQGMLGPTTLESAYAMRLHEIRRTVKRVADYGGSPVRVGEEMFVAVINVVTRMLWGGTVDGREFRDAVAEFTELLGTPNLSDFVPVLRRLDLQGVGRKIKKVSKKFDYVFERVIENRLKSSDKDDKRDFLRVLLKMKDEYEHNVGDNEVPFTMIHVKALLLDMVVGGTDTVSNTVEFAMVEIASNPKVLQKVQEELDLVIGKNSIPEEHHIPKLLYLQAVMKETLRLYPALPLLVPRRPSETRVVGGYTIPKDSQVFVNVWAIHRDPSIWANPLEFDPERFLNNRKFDYTGNDFSYFPFGSGRRICTGRGLAERMVLLALASLLHSFDWKWPSGEEKKFKSKCGIVLSNKDSLMLIPQPRHFNCSLYE